MLHLIHCFCLSFLMLYFSMSSSFTLLYSLPSLAVSRHPLSAQCLYTISLTTHFSSLLLLLTEAFLFFLLFPDVFSARYGSPKRQLQFYRYLSVCLSANQCFLSQSSFFFQLSSFFYACFSCNLIRLYFMTFCISFLFYFSIITLLQRLAVLSFKTIHPLVKLYSIDNTYHLLFSWQCAIQLKPDRGDNGFGCKVAHKMFESTITLSFFS